MEIKERIIQVLPAYKFPDTNEDPNNPFVVTTETVNGNDISVINLNPSAILGDTEEFDFNTAITAWLLSKGAAAGKVLGYNGTDFTFITGGGGGPVEPTTVVWTYDDIDMYWSKPTGGVATIDGSNIVPNIGAPVYNFVGSNGNYGGILRRNENVTNHGTYKLEVYLKKTNYDYVGIRLPGAIVGESCPFINLTDFTVNNLDQDDVTCTVTILTDGWCKFSVKCTDVDSSNTIVDVCLVNSTGSSSYNPLGTSSFKLARTTLYTI